MVIFTDLLLKENNMKTLIKNNNVNDNQAKINSTVKVDRKLDKIKNIKFKSNKVEEVNKLDFKLTF